MVHFFGILNPNSGAGRHAGEAPGKTPFFSLWTDSALGAVPMSRTEQEACYLAGKHPEPLPTSRDDDKADRHDH